MGVERGKRGLILVDETYRTNIPSIYAAGDVIGLESEAPGPPSVAPDAVLVEPLLQPAIRDGEIVGPLPSLRELQQRAAAQVDALPEAVRKLIAPSKYVTEISEKLQALVIEMQTR